MTDLVQLASLDGDHSPAHAKMMARFREDLACILADRPLPSLQDQNDRFGYQGFIAQEYGCGKCDRVFDTRLGATVHESTGHR